MIRPFRSLLKRARAPEVKLGTPVDAPRPEFGTYVIGDVHGCADLLERALDQIDIHVGAHGVTNPQVVFVGDYIDHGPDSAATLARVWELTQELPENVTCLMGNHERMMLDFLIDPVTRGPRWLRAGAAATLESFGLQASGFVPGCPPADLRQAALDLRAKLGEELLAWLEALPTSWQSGNLWAVHAGADPQYPMQEQSARVLLWGHPEFGARPRGDGQWVLHGHTPAEQPIEVPGRICVDTDAWRTGLLTTAAIHPSGEVAFLYA